MAYIGNGVTKRWMIAAGLMAAFIVQSVPGAMAQVELQSQEISTDSGPVSVYSWTESQIAPQAVVIGLHGSVQHGKNFTAIANQLAQKGIIFYGMDSRGHGKWLGLGKVDYRKSAEDLVQFAEILKKRHNLPIFCMGESVGATMAIQAAATKPKLFDGLILASAGTRPRFGDWKLTLQTIKRGIKTLGSKIDLSGHIAKIGDDPRSSEEMLSDPQIRKNASVGDLIHTALYIKESNEFAETVDTRIPILMLQGSEDHVINPDSAKSLFAKLRTSDKRYAEFKGYGHLLVTTAYLKPDVVDTVWGWLAQHSKVNASV
jgi:acylglycerol lipase